MKGKKKAFLLSFLSLLMCVSMFIGTTFAWFTDSATSGVNTIVAGNLDIVAEYNELKEDGTLGETWTDLQGSDSLFSRGLWEPGHTEYAVIRINNAGTLALKYQVRVDVVSETGSINVAGRQFKLSDYLKYGVEYGTEVPSINRVGAVAMAGANVGAYVSDTRILAAGAGYDYMVLAITMPETVGNEANYDKQYNAPSIDLGITVLATQTTSESDSFGPDYDGNAQYPAPTFTTSTNVVFPVKNTVEVQQDATEVTVALTANTTNGNVNLGSVIIPASRVQDGATNVTVELKPATTEQESNFGSVATGKEAKYYDISVSNLNEDSGLITVTLQLDPGLTDVVIKHYNGTNEEVIDCTYDGATGIVTFKTTSFSPYAVEYKSEKVAEVGGVYYSTLIDAVNAAKANGGTVVLLQDAEGSGIKAENGDNFTIDFNGYTYNVTGDLVGSNGTVSQAAQLLKGATVKFMNGTLTSTRALMIIQNYCNLTLDNMTIDGTKSSGCGYVVSTNCGNVTITGDTNILASTGKVALDVMHWENNAYKEAGSHVTIDEKMTGKVDGIIDVYCYRNSAVVSPVDDNGATLTIKGGIFTVDPTEYVAIGYEVKENGDLFEVSKKVYNFSCGADTKLNAQIPEDATVILTQEDLNSALAAVETSATLYLGEGNFYINAVNCNNKDISFVGAGYDKTTLYYGTNPSNPGGEAGSNYHFEGSNVSFKDVTLIDGNGDDVNYKGFVRCASMFFENCVLKSRMTYLGVGDVTFRNCTFETPKYAMWVYGSQTFNFSNCLFNSPTGRFLNIYSETAITPTINATECRFVDSSDGTDSNAVFNIKSTATTTLNIMDCEVIGASPMYKVASDNGSVVTIDGNIIYGTNQN